MTRQATVDVSDDPERILVLRSGGLGDCILATPALAALRKRFPNAHITLLGDPFSAFVFTHSPDINRLVALDSKLMPAMRYAAELLKLRTERFSLLIDLHGNGRTFTQTLAIGARRRIGMEVSRRMRRAIYTDRVPIRTDVHNVLRQLYVLAPLGIDPEQCDTSLRFFFCEEEHQDARRLLEEHGLSSGEKYVVLHATAGAGRDLKQWQSEKYALVSDWIQRERGLRVVLSGMRTEEFPMVEQILSRVQEPVVNLFDQTSLRELAAIVRGAELYFGCDTGPMHLAAAVGTPVVALFGPTDPVQWRPWTRAPHTVLRAGLACSPCAGKGCPFDVACMKAIDVPQSIAALDQLLQLSVAPRGGDLA